MKILWIKSDFPLPADTGGKIRTWNLLIELAKHHEVTFLSYIPPGHEQEWVHEITLKGINAISVRFAEEKKEGLAFFLRVLSRIFSSRPYIVNKYISQAMSQRICHLESTIPFDVLVCDFLEMAWYAKHAGNLPTVLFEHNVESLIWRRYHQTEKNFLKKLYFAHEKRRMERFEHRACATMDLVLTVSDNDKQILRDEFGIQRCVTIPTGVDTEYFRPFEKSEVRNRLVFSGSMDWMPNIDGFWWFYRSVYPIIQSSMPDVTFTVIGRRPPKDIQEVAQNDHSVQITGTVDDIRPYLAEGQLYVVPLRVGGGRA